MVLLEGDGLIEDMYYLLWKKDSPFYKEQEFKVNLPQTIIYKNKKPAIWYFTSRHGVINRKKTSRLLPEIIKHEFLKNVSQTGIVAYYIYRVKKSMPEEDQPQTIFKTKEQKIKEQMNDEIFIRYFNEQQFVEFLNDNNKPDHGVLQKFIDSYGEYNFVIQEVWSPVVCMFTKKVNLKKANETRFDIYERAMTFEGAEFYSKNVPLRGGTIPGKLRNITDKIVQHVADISYEKLLINRMVAYFKVDPNENIWFLWCSSVRVKEMGSNKSERQFRFKSPVEVNSTVKVEQDIKLLRTNHIDHPAKLNSNISCVICKKKVNKDELVNIKYKYLIKHEEMQQRRGPGKNNRKGKIEIYNAFQPIDQVKGEKLYLREEKTIIPEVIQRLHPKMRSREYEAIKDTDAFLFQTALICDDCFLMISTNLYDETAGLPAHVRSKSSNRELSPIRQPVGAYSRYALRQIVLEKNKEYLEYTNQEERNSSDLQLHSFLIQQNLKQYDEAMQKFTKKKVAPLDKILNPDVFYSSHSKDSTQINSSGSKHPLSRSVQDSKLRSSSHVNSFKMSYPDQRSADSHDDTELDDFESLRSELASIYRLKPRNMPHRKIVSAKNFQQVIKQIAEPKTERAVHKSKPHLTELGNESSEYSTEPRRSRSTQKNSAKIGKAAEGKGEKKTNDEEMEEIAEIDKMLNMSLPSNFEIDEEDEGDEEQEKQLEVHFAKQVEAEKLLALNKETESQSEEKSIQNNMPKENQETEISANSEPNNIVAEEQKELSEQNSSLDLEFRRKPTKIQKMKAIYVAKPLRLPKVRANPKELQRVPLRPLADRPKQTVHRKFTNSSALKTNSSDQRSRSPTPLASLPNDPPKATRTGASSSSLRKKQFI